MIILNLILLLFVTTVVKQNQELFEIHSSPLYYYLYTLYDSMTCQAMQNTLMSFQRDIRWQ